MVLTSESFDTSNSLLFFKALNLQCAIHLSQIKKILPIMAMHPLPGLPPYVIGVFSNHGEKTIAIDLATRLGEIRQDHYTLKHSIVVLKACRDPVGILVDTIQGVYNYTSVDNHLACSMQPCNQPIKGVIDGPLGSTLLIASEHLLLEGDLPAAYTLKSEFDEESLQRPN